MPAVELKTSGFRCGMMILDPTRQMVLIKKRDVSPEMETFIRALATEKNDRVILGRARALSDIDFYLLGSPLRFSEMVSKVVPRDLIPTVLSRVRGLQRSLNQIYRPSRNASTSWCLPSSPPAEGEDTLVASLRAATEAYGVDPKFVHLVSDGEIPKVLMTNGTSPTQIYIGILPPGVECPRGVFVPVKDLASKYGIHLIVPTPSV